MYEEEAGDLLGDYPYSQEQEEAAGDILDGGGMGTHEDNYDENLLPHNHGEGKGVYCLIA